NVPARAPPNASRLPAPPRSHYKCRTAVRLALHWHICEACKAHLTTTTKGTERMGSGLVVLREGFEASLVVAIVLAFLDRSDRRDGFAAVWIGIAAALTVSLLVGVTLFAVGAELEGTSEYLFEGVTTILAAGLLVW